MKKTLAIIAGAIILVSCGNGKDAESEARNKIIKNTQHDVDSIAEHFDQVKAYVEMGYTTEQAERMVDSVYQATQDMIHGALDKAREEDEKSKK
jgi:Holliday junction resolvasome RuvABC DNA-binding subunit